MGRPIGMCGDNNKHGKGTAWMQPSRLAQGMEVCSCSWLISKWMVAVLCKVLREHAADAHTTCSWQPTSVAPLVVGAPSEALVALCTLVNGAGKTPEALFYITHCNAHWGDMRGSKRKGTWPDPSATWWW
jgi:hypothetical protein